jgi:predicted RecA/RadA family phage recombinase
MKNFVQIGDVLDYTPGSAVASGAVVVMGVRIGIAVADIAANQTGAVRVKGVVELAKLSTDTPAQGALLYWDAANARLTTTATDNVLAGYAAKAAGNGATTVWLHLNA